MNIYCAVICCQILIFPIFQAQPDNEIPMRVIDGNEEIDVNLKEADSYLANIYLPVWTVSENRPYNLIPDKKVMHKISPFSMYHDPDRSAAALYFQKLDRMFGAIDVRYIIRAVPNMDVTKEYPVVPNQNFGVIARDLKEHENRKTRSAEFLNCSCPVPPPNDYKSRNETVTVVRLRRTQPEIFYIQVLVFVNYDMTKLLRGNSEQTNLIVLYILSLFNNVDMLFSKVNDPIIKINIAGIIIGKTHDSFIFLRKCYKNDKLGTYLNSGCANEALRSHLPKITSYVPQDSYDVAILLTRYPLLAKSFGRTDHQVAGLTCCNSLNPYQLRLSGTIDTPVITAVDLHGFGSYYIIAHEIGHALRFNGHDKGPYVDDDKNCRAHIMRPIADYCKDCLSWSSKTLKHFKKYFSSYNRCLFVNKPRSLEKPGARRIKDADEQCECYGYESAMLRKPSFIKKLCGRSFTEMCVTNLHCKDIYGESHEAPFPFDGTDCDTNKVCWNRECVPAEL